MSPRAGPSEEARHPPGVMPVTSGDGLQPLGRLHPLALAFGRDLDHVPGEAGALQHAHEPAGRVELEAPQAVDRRARERVVVVVPGLAERRRWARPCSVISQPMCAKNRPRSAPRRPDPWPTWGECGSPSTSVWAWCLRWSATQLMTGPWTDIVPSTASAYSIHLWVWKARWVSRR